MRKSAGIWGNKSGENQYSAEGALPLTVRIASVEEMVHDELGHQTETLLFKKETDGVDSGDRNSGDL
ncbi:MAG: hypothetical protein V8S96_03170 [Lachnospiraceae bacterium]